MTVFMRGGIGQPPSQDAAPPALSLQTLSLGYTTPAGVQTVLSNLSLQLSAGEIACLLGPSGCGKTTVLRAIAGFDPVLAGEITLQGLVVSSAALHIPTTQRRIGMVFQDYALFPHLDVAGNIAFGLRGTPRTNRNARVKQMLALVGLEGLGSRAVHTLSGGQQQRVALARALAPQPTLLLMDEPFSNLDVTLRERLAMEVRELLRQTGTTAIIVTHDQHEAFAVADRVAVLADGLLQQWDTPMALYHQPANRLVASFIGEGVMLAGSVGSDGSLLTELGRFQPHRIIQSRSPGQTIELLIRPDDIVHDDDSPVQALVVRKAFRGAQFLYTLALSSGQELLSLVPSHHDHALGERIGIRVELDHVMAFEY